MNEKYGFLIIVPAFLLGVLFMLVFTATVVKPTQYKRGQTDAINGEIKYELVTQPDSTRTWEKIK